MKPMFQETTCSCANQMLLMPGCTCDICGGLVPEQSNGNEPAEEWYDAAYFEALEASLQRPDLAA